VVNHDQRSGNYALRVANPPGTSEQTITGLTPSTTYVFSGWGKVATAGEPICLGYKWYGGSQWTACPNTTSYMHVSNLFTTGATDTPPPTDTPTPAPTVPAGTNLLTNPGFETGSLPPWTLATGNGGVTLSFPRSGSYSGYVGTGVGRIEQTVTGLKPNTTYDLAAWIKLASGADSVRVGVKDYGGADSYESATSTSYTQVSLEFTTGGSNTSATVNLYQPDSGESYAWSDDWSLTAQ
jgi:hypothetical protein